MDRRNPRASLLWLAVHSGVGFYISLVNDRFDTFYCGSPLPRNTDSEYRDYFLLFNLAVELHNQFSVAH